MPIRLILGYSSQRQRQWGHCVRPKSAGQDELARVSGLYSLPKETPVHCQ